MRLLMAVIIIISDLEIEIVLGEVDLKANRIVLNSQKKREIENLLLLLSWCQVTDSLSSLIISLTPRS